MQIKSRRAKRNINRESYKNIYTDPVKDLGFESTQKATCHLIQHLSTCIYILGDVGGQKSSTCLYLFWLYRTEVFWELC